MKFSTHLLILLFIGCYTPAFGQYSLYSDIKAHKPGDVITVILTENISGSSSTGARTNSNTSGSAESSIKSNFIPFQPVFGGDAEVNYDSDERMTAEQQQLLQGTLSVRVKEVTENNDLLVSGKRSTEINGQSYKMSVEGYVRPSDINDANEVLSYRLADANITYQKEGGIDKARRKAGIGRKIVWGVLGVVTGAAAIMSSQ